MLQARINKPIINAILQCSTQKWSSLYIMCPRNDFNFITGEMRRSMKFTRMTSFYIARVEEALTHSTKLSSIIVISTGLLPVISSKSMTPNEKTSDFSLSLPLDAYSGAKYLHLHHKDSQISGFILAFPDYLYFKSPIQYLAAFNSCIECEVTKFFCKLTSHIYPYYVSNAKFISSCNLKYNYSIVGLVVIANLVCLPKCSHYTCRDVSVIVIRQLGQSKVSHL